MADVLSSSTLLPFASDVMTRSGYKEVAFERSETWSLRLFEDEFGVVAICAFDTVGELLARWPTAQADLVTILSRSVNREESKAWEGYLVLLTPASVAGKRDELEAIRYNTTRVRKIVATGDELRTIDDVRRVLSGLLPFAHVGSIGGGANLTALDLLPEVLVKAGVSTADADAIVSAFVDHRPLLPALHERGTS